MADKPRKLFAKHIVRKLFLEDWATKLIALVITFGLWFAVTGLSTPTVRRMSVPLSLSVANNAEITNVPPQDVEIAISGDKRKIDQINKSELVATLDLADVAAGDHVVSLSPENVYVALPRGIKLVEITPSRIAINLEAVEEKEIEVKAITTGIPAVGYEVYSTSVLPPKIRVRGPVSIIKMLEYVQTDTIDITGKKDGFSANQLAVTSPNPKAAVLNTVVDVVLSIGERRMERPFTVPIPGLPAKTASFIVLGPRTLLQKTKADEFKVEMILDDNGEEVPHVIMPPGLQNLAEISKLTIK